MAGAAELERNQLRERTAAALAHLRAGGVVLGGEALGWVRDDETDSHGRRVVREVEEEAATVARIIELREAGMSLRDVATTLTAEGRKTKRGGAWYASTVRAVLARQEAA